MHNILQASTFMGWAKHFDVIGTEDTMFYILNISKEKLRDIVNSVCVNGLAYSFLLCKMLCKLIKIKLELHPQHVYVPKKPPKKTTNSKRTNYDGNIW